MQSIHILIIYFYPTSKKVFDNVGLPGYVNPLCNLTFEVRI